MRLKNNYSKTKFFLFPLFCAVFCLCTSAQSAKLTFTTSRAVGESIKIMVEGSDIKVEGVENVVVGAENEYKLTSSTVTIQGNLTTLRCLDCDITEIDLSQAKTLTQLVCSGNAISKIDASHCAEMQKLYCNSNGLQVLNVDNCSKITDLYCFQNNVKKLDVTSCKALVVLSCTENKIEELDLTNNVSLEELYCGDNKLKQLNLKNNEKLKTLWCNDNQLPTIDLSRNKELRRLYCQRNSITALNLTANTKINRVNCFLNKIKAQQMTELMESLPTKEEGNKGKIYVVDKSATGEGNKCTKSDVTIATAHYWTVYDYNQNKPQPYEGEDPAGISNVATHGNDVKIMENGICLLSPAHVAIYTIDGKIVCRRYMQGGIVGLDKGLYIAVIGGQKIKIAIR